MDQKPFPFQCYDSPYWVDRDGRIFRYEREVKGSIHPTGYYYVGLTINGKSRSFQKHRVIAEARVPNLTGLPFNKLEVDHIDRNKTNNHPSNLQWITKADHAKKDRNTKSIRGINLTTKEIRDFVSIQNAANSLDINRMGISNVCNGNSTYTTSKVDGSRWTFEFCEVTKKKKFQIRFNEDDEVWKPLDTLGYPGYEVSNYCRLKSFRISSEGRIMKTRFIGDDLHGCVLLHNEKGENKGEKIYRLGATVFLSKPEDSTINWVVDHIDQNPLNNHISNLRWVTQAENVVRKPVVQLGINGEIIEEFTSIAEAHKQTEINRGSISEVANGKRYKTAGGFKWQFCCL